MTAPDRPLRFGLVGTGHWARVTHAPALASTAGIEFAGVWGRNPEAAVALAGDYSDVAAHADFESLLAEVDGLAFAVPPDVQCSMALRAAQAGKHLLLEKPIALSDPDSAHLAQAVGDAGVASVVFFTARFHAGIRRWLAEVTSVGGWTGGCAVWLGTALDASSPFNTPWRQQMGALWDLAPHLISLFWVALGPVAFVTADAGPGDLTHLVMHHDGGATSALTMTLGASKAAEGSDLYVWGDAGRSFMPTGTEGSPTALRVALSELADNARAGRTSHPCDVTFGREVVRLLADAQRQIEGLGRSRS